MIGVNNRIMSLVVIEFIAARNAEKDSIPGGCSEATVRFQSGDCLLIKRRDTRSGQKEVVKLMLHSYAVYFFAL